ncbi:uncharacterized protein LOC101863636 [Aplysia californica]|uniref:Uncharacterized protein LOC101863636 n=1 Tax=Aplysia californica TaxID=6500 RepID=A0ABM0JC88_APLCA|nr:uncharacterized protein LOC101863636 [Aplysia californica]
MAFVVGSLLRVLTRPLQHMSSNAASLGCNNRSAHRCISTAFNQDFAGRYSALPLKQDLSNGLCAAQPVIKQCVRTKVRVYYKGSAWKRYNKHNIEKRLTSPGGLEVLWRRVLKGKHQLAVYERILPNTVNSKVLPPHHFKYRPHPITKTKLPKRELL